MKKRSILACILVMAVLITSMCPLCVFAEDPAFSISGYVGIISDPISPGDQTELFYNTFVEPDTTFEQFILGLKKGVTVTVEGTDFSAVSDANGFFEIKNVPAKETGYVLKFSRQLLNGKEVVLDSFTKDVYYDKSSPVTLRFDWDLNDDNAINMKDVTLLARYLNQTDVDTHKISGYVKIKMIIGEKVTRVEGAFPESFVKELTPILIKKVNVEVKGTAFSAVTDDNGYFEIKNVPASESGYVLKFSIGGLAEKEVAINSFNQDITYDQNNSVTLEVDQDINKDGTVNMLDVNRFARLFNQVVPKYKISGYVKIKMVDTVTDIDIGMRTTSFPDSLVKALAFCLRKDVTVEVKGTAFSAVTDSNGYFEIENLPASESGYVLKFSGYRFAGNELVINSFNQDITYDKNNRITLEVSMDANKDGIVNIKDVVEFTKIVNGCYKISGYIAPDFKSDSSVKDLFNIEIDGISIAMTRNDGYFEFEYLPVNEKGYTIKITKSNYLYKEMRIDSFISDMEISSIEKPLIMNVGDINNDNAVNIRDIVLIASAFNTTAGDGKYKTGLDLNADGVINLVDIVIASKNFNKVAQAL